MRSSEIVLTFAKINGLARVVTTENLRSFARPSFFSPPCFSPARGSLAAPCRPARRLNEDFLSSLTSHSVRESHCHSCFLHLCVPEIPFPSSEKKKNKILIYHCGKSAACRWIALSFGIFKNICEHPRTLSFHLTVLFRL